MSGVLIMRPLPHGAPPVGAGSGAGNLATADPNEVWIAPNVAPATIVADAGTQVLVDSFLLGYTNATDDASWSIATMTDAVGGGLVERHSGFMRPLDSLGPRHHAFVRLPNPISSRYFQLTVDQGGPTPLHAGIFAFGISFEKHREYGPGRAIIDGGKRSDLPSGGFGSEDGAIKAQFSFSFVDLTDLEVHALEAIQRAVGLRRPVVVVEDADATVGRNEAIHYGVFDRFQAINRADPAASGWAGTVIEWA